MATKFTKENQYTFRVFKTDKRRKTGTVLWTTHDFYADTEKEVKSETRKIRKQFREILGAKFHSVEVYKTYEVKVNLLSGEKFLGAVGTPRCCDPSSEAYWSM